VSAGVPLGVPPPPPLGPNQGPNGGQEPSLTGQPSAVRRWADLRTRTLSAIVLLVLGGVAGWAGGGLFLALCLVVSAGMHWELGRMAGARHPALAGLAGVLAMGAVLQGPAWLAISASAAAMGAIWLMATRLAAPAAAYGGLIVAAGASVVALRETVGAEAVLWLVCVVIASDMAGYFVGRTLGGPLFWPAISPKKTWSGTVAGWLGAAAVGWGFALWLGAGAGLVVVSALVAFAGQMGDIAESWFKRRAGRKDSSSLIPGHGGVLDRFDAMVFAAVGLGALLALGGLPALGLGG
jgi:phosphatidate cytidylyltransferase